MGQSPNESHGFETNGNKYKCVRHSKTQMLFMVRHESRRCKFVKMLERSAPDSTM